jgi:hypothetical protein
VGRTRRGQTRAEELLAGVPEGWALLRSDCCDAPVFACGEVTRYYVCLKCRTPCGWHEAPAVSPGDDC